MFLLLLSPTRFLTPEMLVKKLCVWFQTSHTLHLLH